MKYILFFHLIGFYTKGYAQKFPETIKEGIYSGGICLDGAMAQIDQVFQTVKDISMQFSQ